MAAGRGRARRKASPFTEAGCAACRRCTQSGPREPGGRALWARTFPAARAAHRPAGRPRAKALQAPACITPVQPPSKNGQHPSRGTPAQTGEQVEHAVHREQCTAAHRAQPPDAAAGAQGRAPQPCQRARDSCGQRCGAGNTVPPARVSQQVIGAQLPHRLPCKFSHGAERRFFPERQNCRLRGSSHRIPSHMRRRAFIQ